MATPPTLIDFNALPGVVAMNRVIDLADRFLVSSARANAANALATQRANRLAFEAEADDWHITRPSSD